jgi:hypothetical protein
MSYDVAIVSGTIATSDAAAWSQLDTLLDQRGEPPPVFRRLHDTLVARYPCISTLSDDMADDGAWSSGPLWGEFGPATAHLAIRHSHAEEVTPFIIERARALGLAVFDWTKRHIHRPDGLTDLELTIEDQYLHGAPTLQQVMDAARALTPDGGPGFLILERAGSGYLQVAGGNGAYACEWRQTEAASFKHWAIGLGRSSESDIKIPTNGFHVTVKSNERLSLADVEALISAFASGGERPAAFAWRDITSRFG